VRRVLATLVLAGTVLAGCGASADEKEAAVEGARAAYEAAAAEGVDFSDGPCIADPIESMPDWVADVAHDPRRDVDNEPENQCSSYRSGDAGHFVELDPDGNLIRAE
jgi:hypothetical protein